jgi:hypothetical protein
MQLAEGLYPVYDVSERRSGSERYGLLLGLHGLLLSLVVSEGTIHTDRVSQVREKITKLVSWDLKSIIAQFTSATVVIRHLSATYPPSIRHFL